MFLADFHRFSRFLVQTLISQPNMNKIKRLIVQNLNWFAANRKHVQFWKSKILLSCYVPLNSEHFFTQPLRNVAKLTAAAHYFVGSMEAPSKVFLLFSCFLIG